MILGPILGKNPTKLVSRESSLIQPKKLLYHRKANADPWHCVTQSASTRSSQCPARHRIYGDPGEEKVMIAWQVRINRGLNADLGQGANTWATSNLMPDVKTGLTEQISKEWERCKSAPLLPEHVSIRWHNNRMPVPDTANLTVGDFYAAHSTNGNAAIYLEDVPSCWKSLSAKKKQVFMALELYVDTESNHRDPSQSSVPQSSNGLGLDKTAPLLLDNDSEEPTTPDVPDSQDDPIDQQIASTLSPTAQ
ncbi:hypothetical protein K438DRAFT_1766774 [Mycena galopus ATCC 62051]|nr:hypothetical protein K438DRAFT_1766774 [Mycena galopus ATCC 62051]